MEDRTIIDLFWQRAEEALTECGRRYGRYCQTIAINILRNPEDAQECVNETWLKAWNAIPPARPVRLKAYLGRICRNLALDHYAAARSQKRGGGAIEIALDELAEIPLPENTGEGEITRVLNSFLRLEPPELAAIFVKRYWYLMSDREIAREYGYSRVKVASILYRMRQRLKNKLESEGLM